MTTILFHMAMFNYNNVIDYTIQHNNTRWNLSVFLHLSQRIKSEIVAVIYYGPVRNNFSVCSGFNTYIYIYSGLADVFKKACVDDLFISSTNSAECMLDTYKTENYFFSLCCQGE